MFDRKKSGPVLVQYLFKVILLCCICLSCFVALLAGCSSSDPEPPALTASELTTRGWGRFETGDISRAKTDFDNAIAKNSSYGPAFVGRGWCRLVSADGLSSMQGALSSFDDAVLRGENSVNLLAGRAAASLGSGIAYSDQAIVDAQAVLDVNPGYVFTRRTSFNANDLNLIVAFANSDEGDYFAALEAADLVVDSGILAADPGTWVVDGVTYDYFIEVVLVFLQKVSDLYAG